MGLPFTKRRDENGWARHAQAYRCQVMGARLKAGLEA